MRGRNACKGRTKHRSSQSNRTPSLGKSLEVASGSQDIGKRPRNVLFEGRPNGYSQIFETGHRSKIRNFDVLRSDDLKNKVANAKGAYVQLKVARRLQVDFRIERIDPPTTRRKKPREPNVNISWNGQSGRKFSTSGNRIKRLVTPHVINNDRSLKGK